MIEDEIFESQEQPLPYQRPALVKRERKKPNGRVVRRSKNDSLSLWNEYQNYPDESDLNDLTKWLGS
jgi:hypothetical protein